jgi:hypothetical protein
MRAAGFTWEAAAMQTVASYRRALVINSGKTGVM